MLSSYTDSTTAITYFMAHPPKSSANFSTSRTLLLGSSFTPTLMTTLPCPTESPGTPHPSTNPVQTPPHHI
ncbi:hypothetical protein LDENG_00217650 [Lucifuga dentata]|nr:hypothetical protein LDENG_00217650 [Lucifuga dentata]